MADLNLSAGAYHGDVVPSERSILDAVLVAVSFWDALGSDDRRSLDQLLSSTWQGRPDNFASLYLADRELAPEACRFMGIWTYVDVLAEDRLRFWFRPTDRVEPLDAGVPAVLWRLEVVLEAGAWRVDRSGDAEKIARVALPAPEAPDPKLREPRSN